MNLRGPELLTRAHHIATFSSGAPALDAWLVRHAVSNQASGASRTWVVVDAASGRVVGYYASATGAIVRSAATRRASRNQPEEIPCVLLARLAVDRAWQGQGLGSALLKHFLQKGMEVAEIVGVRLFLVHAVTTEARDFYRHFGFEPSPINELTLMRVL